MHNPEDHESRASVALEGGWNAELRRQPAGAVLRMRGPVGAELSLEVLLTPMGPVVRARAAAIELEADSEIVARCSTFRVEAKDAIELVAGGTLSAEGRRLALEATHGSARMVANDDVQFLGENVLLNCERPSPLPHWLPARPTVPGPSLPLERVSGDRALLDALGER